jgi:large subunit ribosomal protein L15
MALTLHTIAPKPGARKKKFRIGRGNASGRGTTAGRGTKGQRARSGGRKHLKLKGLKQMILAFPKLRGFKSRFTKPVAIPLERIAKAFPADARIDIGVLKSKELIPRAADFVKLVGNTGVDKAYTFVNIVASAPAKAAVEKAGGSFIQSKKAIKEEKAAAKKTKKR